MKSRYSKEAWERKLAYGRAYRKRLQESQKGRETLKKYRKRWYVKHGKSAAEKRRRMQGIAKRALKIYIKEVVHRLST